MNTKKKMKPGPNVYIIACPFLTEFFSQRWKSQKNQVSTFIKSSFGRMGGMQVSALN
jgi:hypothetical protein